MREKQNIGDTIGSERYSVQLYGKGYFDKFDPANLFEKWAAVEVPADAQLPNGMERLTLPGGLYAVFHYQGSSTETAIFNYIFTEWLPASGYELDDHPHFEVLGEKYKNADSTSEEDIWIPIRIKENKLLTLRSVHPQTARPCCQRRAGLPGSYHSF